MTGNYLANPGRGWFVARMGILEWLETALKLAAVGAAIWGVSSALSDGVDLPLAGRVPQVAIMGLASTAILFAVLDRLRTREVISMCFVVLNNIGHWAMTLALVAGLGTTAPVITYCSAMAAGDLVKLAFFWRTGLTVRNAPRAAVLGGTGLFVLAYLAVLLLETL